MICQYLIVHYTTGHCAEKIDEKLHLIPFYLFNKQWTRFCTSTQKGLRVEAIHF